MGKEQGRRGGREEIRERERKVVCIISHIFLGIISWPSGIGFY